MRHTSIKRGRLTTHSQLKFTPARVQRDSATALLLRIRGLPRRVDRILVLLLQLSKLLIKASLVVCIALCVSFEIIFQAGEEEEEEEEGRGHRNCNRHITSQSFRGRWTSTGGVRISSASRDTSSSQSALSPALSPLESCCERPWRVRVRANGPP